MLFRSGREKLWSYLHLLKKVRTQLISTMETGKLAQVELQHQQTMRDRVRGIFSRAA